MAFYRDMGPKPDGLTLDRIDNNGNYSPENCRWATRRTQRLNQGSRIRWIEFRGDRMNMTEAAEKYGINREALKYRIDRGWPIEKALLDPVRVR